MGTRSEGRKVVSLDIQSLPNLPYVVRYSLTLPPSLTPAAMKKLVEKRNGQFCDAVNESVHRPVRDFPANPHFVTDLWPGLLNRRTLFPSYERLAGVLFL